MKKFLHVGLFILFILASGMLIALPEGNYIQSCNSCSEFNNSLRCSCNDQQGFPRFTQLDYEDCDPNNNYITNQNGTLTCGDPKYSSYNHHYYSHQDDEQSNLPYGNYQQTCQQCYVNGDKLHCVCLTQNQQPQATSIGIHHCYKDHREIVNTNGNLTCGDKVKHAGARLYMEITN